MNRDFNKKRCRTCLSENVSELFDWNSKFEAVAQCKLTYLECYRECTHLEASIGDFLPQTICYKCAKQLRDAYFFIELAKKSNQALLLKEEQNFGADEQDSGKANFEWVTVQKHDEDDDDFTIHPIKMSPARLSPAVLKIEHDEETFNDDHVDSLLEKHNLMQVYDPAKDNESDSKVDEPLIKTKRIKSKSIVEPIKKDSDYDPESLINCEFCGLSLPRKDIKRHTTRAHKPPLMLCHACPRTFKDASNLRIHAETHEENRKRNYTCEHCDRKFFTKTAYQSHSKIHESNRKAVFQCEQCEKSFFHKGSLKLHMKGHTGATVECQICSKKYLRAVDLEIHLRSHSGDTPYKCSYCQKCFTQVGILNKHVRHHEGYRYKCEICSKEYLHQSTLIQHRKEHTGLPLKCSICEKGFVKRSKLKRHISGVHKVKQLEQMEELIVKVKTKREYRGRILETE